MRRTHKNTRAPRGRAAVLALALPVALSASAEAQTATERQQPQQTEQEQRDAAGRRVAASYGVTLEEISVYADRGPQPFLEQTQNVTVIDRKQLEERQVRDVQDLVRYVPGVTVSKTTSSTDPFGNLAGFTIRGVSNNRVLQLVDGARVIESIVDGNRDFVGMGNLKAVEIIRGPAGVLYGADALGGLVAFVTKDPEDYLKGRNFGGQIDTGYDSYDNTWSKSGTAAFRWGEWSALIGASQRSYNEGTLSNADPNGGIWPCPRNREAIRCNELNPLDGNDYDLLGKVVWNPNAEHEVKFITQVYRSDKTVDQRADLGLQAGGIRNLSYIRNQVQSSERYQLIHRYTPQLGWIDQIRWFVSHSPFERDFTGDRRRRLANGQLDRLDFLLNYKEQFTEGDIQFNSSFATPFATHKLTYGAYVSVTETDYQRRDTTTNLATGAVTTVNAGGFNFADATTRRADGFLQDEIGLFDNRWILTPGLRYATYELDPRPNPFYRAVPGKEPRETHSEELVKQLGSVWRINENISLVGRYAEGFKMPTSQQLFTSLPNGGGTNSDLIPNPDLRPERVKSYEAGVRIQGPSGFFSVTGFRADYTDFIQNFVQVPSATNPGFFDFTYQNLSKVNTWGVEVEGEYRFLTNWIVSASLAFIDGTQVATPDAQETAFDGTTPFSGTFGIRYVDPEIGFDAQLLTTWASQVLERSSPALYRPDGYVAFDAIFAWSPRWVPGLTLRASVLNIGDARYFRSLNGATSYPIVPTTAVASANPLELQIAPGRTFKVGANYQF
ncbi:TonB-dependent hemoglobin/transferrin/lactoferrin family receptor [Bradyrhizobium sp. LHD-71]|uniref:TonB-dependent hemoglobin/transferrin/lactoferrin family receptor n=1 Tax=Bradyrhizobium sp. LHD-71 TaxID=3072141 RepID=UPI00280DE849|nr:TonB-dependent hemoglobin/transferrin/lactoferrin family receptor [Bradyrhizobium sp. LHD-71]MDQ8729592.1 TonB-dependent hemoglobin/transferrin/lactoferrin family receptor [Bradyrhizobium sp. LHD-71]